MSRVVGYDQFPPFPIMRLQSRFKAGGGQVMFRNTFLLSRKTWLGPLGLFCLTVFASTLVGQVIGQPYRIDDKQVKKTIERIEKQSDKFRGSLDAGLDKSRFNGSTREDDINAFVKDFYRETKHLHDQFDHHKSVASDVESVLDRAARIDGFMSRYPLTSKTQTDWAALKTNLDELAAAFNVSPRWAGYRNYPTATAVSDVPYRISDKEVEQIIHRIEKQSDRFRSALDAALDKSRLDGTRREDDINAFVKDFYKETKTLHEHFDQHKSTGADVQSVLERGSHIDEFMRRTRLKKNVEREWSNLKMNLDELARVYGVTWRWGY